ncbi:MAG: heme ABC exporter ATP-binding protein CcmA [Armatimonadetes bacterium]|nr:MAG: heme ABC exporter ATP-binding protein CcmA [Armatimonadota bacterium]
MVSLSGVAVRAGAVPILRDVNLSVHPGEVVGIFGANGAGKTTLLRLVATMTRPSEGSGTVFGTDMNSPDRFEVRSRIGYIGHTPGWYPELTLAENMAFVAAAMGIDAAKVGSCLDAVGLAGAKDRRADRCSHGMQRRAEFARVLLTEPDLLLLDEPHSALDADAVDLVDGLVKRTVERGGAAVLVSHDHARVESLAHRILRIKEGTIT